MRIHVQLPESHPWIAFRRALIGLIGVFPLHALYPLMKRWTYWPQAWLGLAMNWGFPVAWLSITHGSADLYVVISFFLGTVWYVDLSFPSSFRVLTHDYRALTRSWTIVYDTIYACQDREDDVHAGVKSTAVLFGSWVRPILMAFTALFLGLLVLAGVLNSQGAWYFVVSCGGAAGHFVWQFASWNPDVAEDGGKKFQVSLITL